MLRVISWWSCRTTLPAPKCLLHPCGESGDKVIWQIWCKHFKEVTFPTKLIILLQAKHAVLAIDGAYLTIGREGDRICRSQGWSRWRRQSRGQARHLLRHCWSWPGRSQTSQFGEMWCQSIVGGLLFLLLHLYPQFRFWSFQLFLLLATSISLSWTKSSSIEADL